MPPLTADQLFECNLIEWGRRVVELNPTEVRVKRKYTKPAKKDVIPPDRFRIIDKLLAPYRGYITPKGYIIIRIDGKPVFQHRAVMEAKLGRKLIKGETVHHINGDRGNNSPQNLELWTTNHPYGIRASDNKEKNA